MENQQNAQASGNMGNQGQNQNQSQNQNQGRNNNQNQNQDNGGGEVKYERLYNVIDALVDTVNLAPNRRNAIKYGIRAVGEFLSEFQPINEGMQQVEETTERIGSAINHPQGRGQQSQEPSGQADANSNQGAAAKAPSRG